MRKISLIFMLIIAVILIKGEFSFSKDRQEIKIDLLWNETIHKMLQEPLWKERDAYDSGHYLMVPLYAAFRMEDQGKIDEFYQFFNKFVQDYEKDNFVKLNTLTQLHFLYLASEYLSLAYAYEEPFPDELPTILINLIESIWYQPAWQWQVCASPDFQNMLERIEWKLENKTTPRSYCRAVIDHELFTFAIAANLKSALLDQSPEFVDEILDIAYKVFKQEVVFLNTTSEQWLFQPGVRTDHPDYAYAGWTEIESNLEKKPVPGVAMDASHFHRFPLWLKSLQRGFSTKGELEKAEYFKKLRDGLAEQFKSEVLAPPSDEFPNYRTTNFMDGHNGVYRYGYITQGEGKGYEPYQLSSTMLLGWWSFLPDESIKDVYCFIASKYPFSEQEIEFYIGPDTTRNRHPFIKGKAKYENGLLELINIFSCESR